MFLFGVVLCGRVAYAAASDSNIVAILITALQGLGIFFDFLIEEALEFIRLCRYSH